MYKGEKLCMDTKRKKQKKLKRKSNG